MEILDSEREAWERQERERRGMFAQDEVRITHIQLNHMKTFQTQVGGVMSSFTVAVEPRRSAQEKWLGFRNINTSRILSEFMAQYAQQEVEIILLQVTRLRNDPASQERFRPKLNGTRTKCNENDCSEKQKVACWHHRPSLRP